MSQCLPIHSNHEPGSNAIDFNAPIDAPVPSDDLDDDDQQDGMLTQVSVLGEETSNEPDLQVFDVLCAGDETSQGCLAEDGMPVIDEPLFCEAYQCYALEIPMSATDVFNWYQERNPAEMPCVASASQRSHAEVHVHNLTVKEKTYVRCCERSRTHMLDIRYCHYCSKTHTSKTIES